MAFFHSILYTKDKIIEFGDYGKRMTEVYNRDFKSIADPQQREAAFKQISESLALLDNAESSNEVTLKSIATMMKAAKEQFSNLV